MAKKKEITKYRATLIGKDGFERVMYIREPRPYLYIPTIEPINYYLESPLLFPKSAREERVFTIIKDRCYKDNLTYKEN